jgi:hypothetical protein
VSRQTLEYASGCGPVARIDIFQRRGHGRFRRAPPNRVDAIAPSRQAQDGASPIEWVILTREQALTDQSSEYAGERAGMNMQDGGQIAGRQSGSQTRDAQHESLRAGHADLSGHASRRALESVRDRPQELHELQYVRQIDRRRAFVAATK